MVQVVRLVSETFNYTGLDRTLASSKKRAAERFPDTIGKHVKLGLPPKVELLLQKFLLLCSQPNIVSFDGMIQFFISILGWFIPVVC